MAENPEPNPAIKIYVSEDTFGFDTELSPEELVFWLDVVKTSVINRVVGETEDE